MRVLPPTLTASSSVRSLKVSTGFSVWKICRHVTPPSVDRHAPYRKTPAYTVPDAFGSYCSLVMPPWNQSTPLDAGAGFTGVFPCRSVDRVKCAPPSVERYTPSAGAFGGVRRPPLEADDPCRATSVPITRVFGKPRRTAIAPIDRFVATDAEPGTSCQLWPPLVDLNRPRPASESPEPLGSPDPA